MVYSIQDKIELLIEKLSTLQRTLPQSNAIIYKELDIALVLLEEIIDDW